MTESSLRTAAVLTQGAASDDAGTTAPTMVMVIQSASSAGDGCARIELDSRTMRRAAKVREEVDATVVTSWVVNDDMESACVQQTSEEILKLYATVVKQQAEADFNQYSTEEQAAAIGRMRQEHDILDSIILLREEMMAQFVRTHNKRLAEQARSGDVAPPRTFENIVCLGGYRAEKSNG